MATQIERPVSVDPSDLATVSGVAASSPVFTEAKLRWWIFNEDTNGLAAAIVRVNNRVFIHMPTFRKWLATGTSKQAA